MIRFFIKGNYMTVTYQDVLEFWFDELTPKDWFTAVKRSIF